jgi:hypothetical protein
VVFSFSVRAIKATHAAETGAKSNGRKPPAQVLAPPSAAFSNVCSAAMFT